MRKKHVVLTILLQMTFAVTISWLIVINSKNDVSAQSHQHSPLSTPAPFLGPVYYGREDIIAVFDHQYPLFGSDDDGNTFLRHYNGAVYFPTPPAGTPGSYIPDGYGYNQHIGVDYYLQYEPVLAAAEGIVTYAGWSDPSNHRASYGLYVRMEHANPSYRVWYGHLSTLSVETGDEIIIDPLDPGNRNRILGISGNTGSLQGCDEPVGNDPLCSAHLHFEVRQIDINRPVNPYGWIGLTPLPGGTPVVDPWSTYIPPQGTPGATSHNLWVDRPAVFQTTDQYPGDMPLDDPGVNNARMIIDDASADFSAGIGDCWVSVPGYGSYNGRYHAASSDDTRICNARWDIKPDAFTPPGEYDLFVHIPQDDASSLGARYTIHSAVALS